MRELDLTSYRQQLLERLLQGILPFWFLALAGGLINVYQAIQTFTQPALARLAVNTAFLYLILTALVLYLAFARTLAYPWRAGSFLFTLYVIGVLGLGQASLSGDGRVLLFAFVVLSSVFFEARGGVLALGLSLVTLIVMALLQVRGVLYMPPERQVNAQDPAAWFSAIFVFLTLSVAAWTAIAGLLRYLEKKATETEFALRRERELRQLLSTLSEINQQIVRQRKARPLLEQVVGHLNRNYLYVWISLLERDGDSLVPVAVAGEDISPQQLFTRLSQAEEGIECVRLALQRQVPIIVDGEEACRACPPLVHYPQRQVAVFPLLREGRQWGVLGIAQRTPFTGDELNLLKEMGDDLTYALEKIEAEEQAEQLSRTIPRFLAVREMDELWSKVLQAVHEVLKADRAAIYTYDRENDRLSCLRYSGLSEEYVEAVNRSFRELPGSRVLSSPQPVVVQDVLSDPSTTTLREAMLREGFRAFVVFPIFSASGVVAAFVAYRNAPIAFLPHEISLGQALVFAVSQAIETMRLYDRMRAQASDLGRLYAAAQDMAASFLDPPALLNALAHHLLHALNVTSCTINGLDTAHAAFTVQAESWSEAASPEERLSERGKSFPSADYPNVLRAMEAGLPITLHIGQSGLSPAEQAQFERYRVQSMLFVPILARGRLIGEVELCESRQRREFTQSEIRLAQAMAGFAGTVMESTQLFQELERREAHFRALIENAADGIAIIDENGYFRYLSPSVERLLGYPVQEIQGTTPFHYIHPDDLPFIQEAWEEGIRHPGVIRQMNYRFRNARGEWRYLDTVAQNLLHDPNVRGVVVNFRDVTERVEAQQKMQRYAQALAEAYDLTLEGWAKALELRDELTEGHTRRVVNLSIALAKALGLDNEQIVHIRRGAILHDIGKMGIPDAILHKRGSLSAEEKRIMRRHPELAYEMLSAIKFLRPALDIPYCHHERWDGKGYPRRLKGEAIPLGARLFSVADVWDALTSDRPYRRAWSREKALKYILSQAGKMFDPHIVKVFAENLDQIDPS